MGACASTNVDAATQAQIERERRLNKIINTTMDQSKETEEDILKLLLLGAGESGKSTLFKQIIQLYGKGFSEEARAPYASIVYMNTILSMKTLIQQSQKLDEKLDCHYRPEVELSVEYILNEVKNDQEVDAEIARHIKVLWDDPGLQRTYEHRSMFQLLDACKYFFERVEAMGADDYLPSYQDVLRCRARTTGIVETQFELQNNKFKMLDVGGQRSERKKWFHCFEEVTAVIFVAAINEYDQVLYEDNQTNRIVESLDLFGEICNSRWFRKTSMILFLNKSDLFREKIEKVDMKVCFPDYEDGLDYDKAAAFLKEQFLNKNEFPTKKKVYVHITCATNSENISFTFNVCKDIIVKDGLKQSGLILE